MQDCLKKSELVNFYKQGLPDATCSMLENKIRSLAPDSIQDLDHVKSYALNAGKADQSFQAPLSSTTTNTTPRGRLQSVQFLPNKVTKQR